MRTHRPTWFAAVVALATAAAWLFLAPPQLGGRTTWTSTVGDSMEPLFHKGDLALSKPASTYHVGDIVLYESPVLHRPVLHRIVAIQHGHYFFKGDHNDFVDPGYATHSELLGRLWVHVPHAGAAFAWVGKPEHAAAFAGAAALFIAFTPAGRRRRRRRRRRRGDNNVHTLRGHLHRPRRALDNALIAVALTAGIALAAVGFTHTLARTVAVSGAYTSTGAFSYWANVSHPTPTYPSGVARTGDPLFLHTLKAIHVRFAYRFRSKLPHRVHGTVALSAVVSADTTWHHAYPLAAPVTFKGDRTSISGGATVAELDALLQRVAIDAGSVGANYTIAVRSVVHVQGQVGAKTIDERFGPSLPFTATDSLLKLDVSAPTPAPGATYSIAGAQASALASGLNPTQPGSVPGRAPRMVSVLVTHIAVSSARGLALGCFGIIGVLLILKLLRPRRELWSHEQRVAFQHKVVVVDVVDLDANQPTTDMPDFENLALLAQYCERPVLHTRTAHADAYAVEDGGRLYVYRLAGETPAPAVAPAPGPASQRRRMTRPIAALIGVLALVGVVGTGFTAATLVPPSHAGATAAAAAASQIAPGACSRPLSTVVRVPAGGASFTVPSPNTLVLGSSGNDKVVGSSGYDCFVGGGPTTANGDTFNGHVGGGSECIVAATAKAASMKNCSIVSRSP